VSREGKKEKDRDLDLRLSEIITRNDKRQRRKTRFDESKRMERGKNEDIYARKPSVVFFYTDDSRLYLIVIHIYAFKKYKCQTCLYFIHLYTQIPDNKKKKTATFLFLRLYEVSEFLEKLNRYVLIYN